ncbi:PREDICTED: protein DMR6-LIKE OXYGENASE 2 [Theobroma cacao]|uniref:Protein DMR6-LIKE OXYGENASE 2 n=1 Tax=Theobroma cacao TaxID=3641 RepID=A0AB32WP68_THECC|nr:PREDICTED: protein DMR6-LIKE OXYGENASE 2 [Theobroma cacao]
MADTNIASVLTQSPVPKSGTTSVPPKACGVISNDSLLGVDDAIPIIDYSMLTSDDPDQRSQAVKNLGKTCVEYGFFAVMNHAIPDSLINGTMGALMRFFDLAEEKKRKYQSNNYTDKIRWGRGDVHHVSREYFKIAAHPQFHCPTDPDGLREILQEYSKRLREVGINLLRGISKSLGVEEYYIQNAMNLQSGYDFFTANDYPPRVSAPNIIGQFPHNDPGLLILLMQNESGGLQLEHKGKWLNANLNPNWIIVNLADHLEVLTNGKYKSTIHRVIVNNEIRRVTFPLFMGPSLEALVSPAPEFVDDDHRPAYRGMSYKDYLEANQHHIIEGKSCLKQIRL